MIDGSKLKVKIIVDYQSICWPFTLVHTINIIHVHDVMPLMHLSFLTYYTACTAMTDLIFAQL